MHDLCKTCVKEAGCLDKNDPEDSCGWYQKVEAIRKFASINDADLNATARNKETAAAYDALGMAEYEAIEAFRRWVP